MGAASTVPIAINENTKVVDENAQPKIAESKETNEGKKGEPSPSSPARNGSPPRNNGDRNSNRTVNSQQSESKGNGSGVRKMSLEMMLPSAHIRMLDELGQCPDYQFGNSKTEAGDVVRVSLGKSGDADGLVIETVNETKVLVDFGDYVKEVLLEDCTLIAKAMDFEEGDKVEVKPVGSQLYFVGKVIKIHSNKSMDVLMDGDDPDDIEYNVQPDNARKLMSRRSMVINRWKKAFMMVLAANFFRRISFHSVPPAGFKLDSQSHLTITASEK